MTARLSYRLMSEKQIGAADPVISPSRSGGNPPEALLQTTSRSVPNMSSGPKVLRLPSEADTLFASMSSMGLPVIMSLPFLVPVPIRTSVPGRCSPGFLESGQGTECCIDPNLWLPGVDCGVGA